MQEAVGRCFVPLRSSEKIGRSNISCEATSCCHTCTATAGSAEGLGVLSKALGAVQVSPKSGTRVAYAVTIVSSTEAVSQESSFIPNSSSLFPHSSFILSASAFPSSDLKSEIVNRKSKFLHHSPFTMIHPSFTRHWNPGSNALFYEGKLLEPRFECLFYERKLLEPRFEPPTARGKGKPAFPSSNRKSAIRSPKSEIRNPQSAIRNPKSEIRNPKSKIPTISLW